MNQPIRHIVWKLYDLFPIYSGANIVASNKVDYHLVGTNYRLLGTNYCLVRPNGPEVSLGPAFILSSNLFF